MVLRQTRCHSDLGLYVHLHCLVADGVFEDLAEAVRLLPADPPTPARMTAVLAQVHEAALAAHADDDLDMDPTLRACVQRSLVGPHLAPAADPVAPPCTSTPRRPSMAATVSSSNGSAATSCARPSRTARLCALVPPPNFHMVRYFGVFVSHHPLRPRVVPSPDTELPGQQLPLDLAGSDAARRRAQPRAAP